MQVENIRIEQLKEYENNPRFNEGAVEAVAASIREFGFRVPIVVDAENVIIAGHTRLKAAKKLGMESVPCIKAEDMTPDQVKAYRLADNKTGELAGWDFTKLEEELAEMSFEMADFGFEEITYNHIDELLLGEEKVAHEAHEKDTFNLTFTFPLECKGDVEEYIRKNGKEYVVNLITDLAKSGGENNAY